MDAMIRETTPFSRFALQGQLFVSNCKYMMLIRMRSRKVDDSERSKRKMKRNASPAKDVLGPRKKVFRYRLDERKETSRRFHRNLVNLQLIDIFITQSRGLLLLVYES